MVSEAYHQNPELVSSSDIVGRKLACCPAQEPWLYWASKLVSVDWQASTETHQASTKGHQRAHTADFGLYSPKWVK